MLIVLVCQAMYPWRFNMGFIGFFRSFSGDGSLALFPGFPGAPAPSAGTLRAGPDPSIAAAKLQSSNSLDANQLLMLSLQEARMKLDDSISKRNAEIQFLNTAISGATGAR